MSRLQVVTELAKFRSQCISITMPLPGRPQTACAEGIAAKVPIAKASFLFISEQIPSITLLWLHCCGYCKNCSMRVIRWADRYKCVSFRFHLYIALGHAELQGEPSCLKMQLRNIIVIIGRLKFWRKRSSFCTGRIQVDSWNEIALIAYRV